MSRPNCSDSASARTRRIRDSSTVWVNSFGAASTAVSSTRPSGRVRLSIAFCCGDRLADSRSRIWSQTVARSSVASAMRHVLPLQSSPGRSRPPDVHRRILPLWIRSRSRSTPLSTGCARLTGVCSGSPPAGRRPASLLVSSRSGQEDGQYGGRVTDGGRPTRRDPDVRRGATATLTASSTARQRSPGGCGRPGADRRARRCGASPSGPTAAGRAWPVGPTGRRYSSLLGYAGASLWPVPSDPLPRAGRSVRMSAGRTSFRGRRGHGRPAVRAGSPRAPVHRRSRTVDVV
jgi:hypothetical protein